MTGFLSYAPYTKLHNFLYEPLEYVITIWQLLRSLVRTNISKAPPLS